MLYIYINGVRTKKKISLKKLKQSIMWKSSESLVPYTGN